MQSRGYRQRNDYGHAMNSTLAHYRFQKRLEQPRQERLYHIAQQHRRQSDAELGAGKIESELVIEHIADEPGAATAFEGLKLRAVEREQRKL